ncbi:MAG: hypothetical protein RIK87_12425 [Fuerstiella sp.]
MRRLNDNLPSPRRRNFWSVILLAGIGWLTVAPASAWQVPASEGESAVTDNGPASPDSLKDDALAISGRYSRFERLLSQMADLLALEDPERAELLRRAISQSRERAIGTNIDAIAALLADESLGDAIEKQEASAKAMEALLKLLQSEDRRSAVEKERERLNSILKDVRNTIAAERAARAAAQNSRSPSNAAPQQQKALKSTDRILDDVKKHDDAQSGESESGESKDGESKDGRNGEGQQKPSESGTPGGDAEAPEDGKPSESEDSPSGEKGAEDPKSGDPNDDGKPAEEGGKPSDKPGDSQDKPADGKPSEGESESGGESKGEKSESPGKSSAQGQSQNSRPGQSDQEQEQTPGREQLEAARNLMQQALEQLQQQEREEAVENQDEAIAQLETAAKELEELLRQLREEEKEMILAALEARFQRLLALQTQIYETTVDLATTPRKDWLDTAVSECRELAQQQADLTRECSQTTALLREDGTSVSIVVAVEDIEVDMATIAGRLQETKVGTLTQSIETDVIEALKELIEATQQEMQEMKSEERRQQQQQSPEQKKPPLVELMAEIRVLRSLQLRVNRRTRQVHDLTREGDPSEVQDLQDQLIELAGRQDRLRESALELAERMEKQR